MGEKAERIWKALRESKEAGYDVLGTARNWFLYRNQRLIQKTTKKHVDEDGSVLLL